MDNTTTNTEILFPKISFLQSEKYRNRRDLLSVILKDGESYTENQVSKKIYEFMKGSVR